MARRIDVDMEKLEFGVLTELLAKGEDYIEEVQRLKTVYKSTPVSGFRKRKIKGEGLKDKDPW